ncbi:hypothetical protein [Neolewinella antarctica]|uniref:mRNA-degrading endonuclease RelE of RelBE toxin-antitoxin system n=1 Tax=Neolewinella antarctica TaxID=442734 RepID=A0ABX0XH57_9BACT|nr:hypothetical protein [Neolewinella antarctica]NJC28184.1 mRNA-degrading endonuclease RelE of RelBE toxin-antitoxin system [Neolewinella antarctica]
MPSRIILTETFKKEAKKLSKKHRSLGADLRVLVAQLEAEPYLGDRLSPQSYKIRLAIKSKGKGKSGGARVLTWVNVIAEDREEEQNLTVYLLSIFDKSSIENIPNSVLDQRIAEAVLMEEE